MPAKKTDQVTNFNAPVSAARDVHIGGKQIYNDMGEVEKLLAQILALLRETQTNLRVVFQDHRRSLICLEKSDGSLLEVPPEFTSKLGQLQRAAGPEQREAIYLTRFTLDHLYARWERNYLPLEGILYLEPSLRLTDAGDQAISPAGNKLKDLREAITELGKPRLVILGEPGTGKTTTLERLALDLARERLRDPVGGKIPIRIDLFKFTDQRNPTDFLANEWQYTGLSDTYGEALSRGQVCFLLDGVNQMPLDDRTRRIEKWAHWANSHSDLPDGNWAIFTCRSADYTSSLRLPEVHVQTLGRERMRHYFELRFGPEQSSRYWAEFDQRLSSGDHRFEHLARNPFMLSLLADNVEAGQGLTDSRAQLMYRLAQKLLQHELEEGRQPPALTADPLGTLTAAMQALARIGFAMQSARGEGTRISYRELEKVKLFDTGHAPLTLEDVLALALNAHVLEPSLVENRESQEAGYTFYHHLLQEYFAARRLVDFFRNHKNLGCYARPNWLQWEYRPRRLSLGESIPRYPVTGWEETLIMSASLAGKDAAAFIAQIEKYNLPLAGRCLAAADPKRTELQPLAGTLRQKLLLQQTTAKVSMNARIAAGLALGELGHPDLQAKSYAFEGRTVLAIPPILEDVPAGEFTFGSNPQDEDAWDDEKTAQRKISLPDFKVGRYPVTNAEFRFFIESRGYADNRWWSEAGKAWKQGGPDAHAGAVADWMDYRESLKGEDLDTYNKGFWLPSTRRFWKRMVGLSDEEALQQARKNLERSFDAPAFWDDPEISNPARPVVGINCYEAEAYCAWLSAVTGRTFRLPEEPEWEKAARGTDGRTYPWGNVFESKNCNTLESHIYETTPVGMFLEGRSPTGVLDASGNVWEWTASWYQAYPESDAKDEKFGQKYRVLRGGSWNFNRGLARCAYRNRYVPDFFYGNVGFRLVSPGTDSSGS